MNIMSYPSLPAGYTKSCPSVRFVSRFAFKQMTMSGTLLLMISNVNRMSVTARKISNRTMVGHATMFRRQTRKGAFHVRIRQPCILISPMRLITHAIRLRLQEPITRLRLRLLLCNRHLNVSTMREQNFMTMKQALMPAINSHPRLIILIRCRQNKLSTSFRFFCRLVHFNVSLSSTILMQPTITVSVFTVLRRLLHKTTFRHRIQRLSMANSFVFLKISSRSTIIPRLNSVNFLITRRVSVTQQDRIHSATRLFRHVRISNRGRIKVIRRSPTLVIISTRQLHRITRLRTINARRRFVLRLLNFKIMMQRHNVTMLRITLINSRRPNSNDIRVFRHVSMIPLRTTHRRRQRPT